MEKGEKAALAATALISLVMIFSVSALALRNFPLSGDEYSYIFQSKVFAGGKLFAASPGLGGFFELDHVINDGTSDGKWYSKYTLGWPFLLSLGQLARLPWLVNPLLAVITLLLIVRLARRYFGGKVAFFAVTIAGTTSFFVFNAASYFPHVSSMLFEVAFLLAMLTAIEKKKKLLGALAGLFLGAIFLIRPADAFIVGLPAALYCTIQGRKDKKSFNVLLTAAAVAAALAGVQLALNAVLLGNPLQFAYQRYGPGDTFAMGGEWLAREFQVTAHRLFLALVWLPLPLLLLPFAEFRKRREALLFLSIIVTSLLVYFFYPFAGGDQFGPRYYSMSFPLVCIIAATAIGKASAGFSSKAAASLVALNILLAGFLAYDINKEIAFRRQVYDYVEGNDVHNSIVFMRGTKEQGCWWYTRNSPSLDDDNLYVCDQQERNAELSRSFPGREALFYDFATLKPSMSWYHKTVRYS